MRSNRISKRTAITAPKPIIQNVLLHAEAFATLAGNAGQFDEKVRIGVGLEREFGVAWRARLDLTWQKVGALFSGAPTDELYIRVRVLQNWM